MKLVIPALALLAASGAYAKVFDLEHFPKPLQQLRNGDSFSVECKDM
jgi:hypothetical protein